MTDILVRGLRLRAERDGVGRLDAGVTTAEEYTVTRTPDGFSLVLSLREPLRRSHDMDDFLQEPAAWPTRLVAERGGMAVGVTATRYEACSRRLVIGHLYVDRPARQCGVMNAVPDAALAEGLRLGAVAAWLETRQVNVAAVRAYRARGFEVCGLDTSLYGGTAAQGDVALFMTRSPCPEGT